MGLFLELIRQSLEIELANIDRESLKCLCNLADVDSSPFVSLQITVTVDVSSRRVPGLQISEEDVDRDADAIRRGRSVRPARWNKQNVTGMEDSFVRMGVGKLMACSRSSLKYVADGARRTGREIELSHIRWRIEDKSFASPNLTENVPHYLRQPLSASEDGQRWFTTRPTS